MKPIALYPPEGTLKKNCHFWRGIFFPLSSGDVDVREWRTVGAGSGDIRAGHDRSGRVAAL
jgi:hypothetical protein